MLFGWQKIQYMILSFLSGVTNFLKYDGGSLSIQTQQLELFNTDDLQISSTQKSMSLAGNVLLDGGGNVKYVRIGSNSTYDRNINISGSSYAIMGPVRHHLPIPLTSWI